MFQRLIKIPTKNSFFLLGPRGSGKSTLLKVDSIKLRNLRELGKAIKDSERLVLSQESLPREVEGTTILPWQDGLRRIFAPFEPNP